MRIKKFKAKNMVEALKKVKEELGEKAVILDSGKVNEGEVELYEVVAAIEEYEEVPLIAKEISTSSSQPQEIPLNSYEELKRELKEIKKKLESLLEITLTGRADPLIKEGVPKEIAIEIEKTGLSLKEFILKRLREKGSSPLSKVQAFIGDAGSGKSTVLFKIAFWFKVKRASKIVVISMDNYKIGGREQAQKLSKLLELPFYQLDWEDLEKNLSFFMENFELLFIDCPSLGKRFSTYELGEISKMFPFLRFSWVVRATDQPLNIFTLWEELKGFPVETLTLTFLDKIQKGFQLFWLLHPEIPLPHFASTGERIPEDLEKIDEKLLLKFFLKNIENSNLNT